MLHLARWELALIIFATGWLATIVGVFIGLFVAGMRHPMEY